MQLEAVDIAAGITAGAHGEVPLGLCLFEETWHQGVVGLVAGRIKDRLHRPVIAFARAEDGTLRGSARSITGVHIRDALDSLAVRHPQLIQKFGGHAMAAGLSLRHENLEPFSRAFAEEIARRVDLQLLNGVIDSDGELSRVELCMDTARSLRNAGPWGQGFPEPVFDGAFLVTETRIVGDKHLKLRLRTDRQGESFDAIAFGYLGGPHEQADLRAGARIELAYRLEVNEYNGTERLQLNCQHLNMA
jgi:single-stranded-DNA-specific exonuclease